MPNETNVALRRLMEDVPAFRPLAYFDKHLDTIRVLIDDCSIWEERCDKMISLYHSNHRVLSGPLGDIVGFSIKGVGHLLASVGMKPEGAINVARFLDALVKEYPTESTKQVLEIFYQLGDRVPADVAYAEAA